MKKIMKKNEKIKNYFDEILKTMDTFPNFRYEVIETKEISFSEEVRKYCEANTCNAYGKSWTCPPGVGTVEQCRMKTLSYSHMLVFSAYFALEDSFDIEGMMDARQDFKKICELLDDTIKNYCEQYLILSNEGCNRCVICTYPEQPCRMPDKLHPSIEGFGIWVNKLADSAGLAYNNGKDTITYFGGLLFNESDFFCGQ